MVTPVVWPSRHQRLLPLGWPVDGASCQASANYACEYAGCLSHFGRKTDFLHLVTMEQFVPAWPPARSAFASAHESDPVLPST
jgi:hypothetical protein